MAVDTKPVETTSGKTALEQSADKLLELLRKGDIEGARRHYEQDQRIFGLKPVEPQTARQSNQTQFNPMMLPPEAR